MGPGLSKGSLLRGFAEDDDIHAAVHAAAFRGEIGCDRAILGVSGSAQTIGTEAVPDDEKTHNFGCPGGGEFPVRGKLGGVDSSMVASSLSSEMMPSRRACLAYLTRSSTVDCAFCAGSTKTYASRRNALSATGKGY